MASPIAAPMSIARKNATATRERGAEVEGERAGAGLVDDRERHGLRVRQQARAGELRARVPGGDEQDERDKPQRQVHSPGR